MNLTQDLKSDFLYVFLSLEATVTEKGIKVSQANKNKIESLNYLLLSFGIVPVLRRVFHCATNTKDKIVRPYHLLTIEGIPNLKIFFEMIDIIHPHRNTLFRYAKNKQTGSHIDKFRFDYKKIRNLSGFFENDREFVGIFCIGSNDLLIIKSGGGAFFYVNGYGQIKNPF